MWNAVFLTDYLVDINNSSYYYDSMLLLSPSLLSLSMFVKHFDSPFPFVFHPLQMFKFCCNLPRGCGKPKTVACAVHWQSRNPNPCTEVVLGMLRQQGTKLALTCPSGRVHLTHAQLSGSILMSCKYLWSQ